MTDDEHDAATVQLSLDLHHAVEALIEQHKHIMGDEVYCSVVCALLSRAAWVANICSPNCEDISPAHMQESVQAMVEILCETYGLDPIETDIVATDDL